MKIKVKVVHAVESAHHVMPVCRASRAAQAIIAVHPFDLKGCDRTDEKVAILRYRNVNCPACIVGLRSMLRDAASWPGCKRMASLLLKSLRLKRAYPTAILLRNKGRRGSAWLAYCTANTDSFMLVSTKLLNKVAKEAR